MEVENQNEDSPQQEQNCNITILQIEKITVDTLNKKFEELKAGILAGIKEQEAKEKNLLTRQETANLLHITLSKLDRWQRQGVIKSHIVANRVYYNRNEVLHTVAKG
jgi:hypothetical protein